MNKVEVGQLHQQQNSNDVYRIEFIDMKARKVIIARVVSISEQDTRYEPAIAISLENFVESGFQQID